MSLPSEFGLGSIDDRQHGTTNLTVLATDLLDRAASSSSGRAAQTVTPGAGAALKQTVMAMVSGQSLADHLNPTAATLQVLVGTVRLTGDGVPTAELHPGDFAPIPPVTHGLDAIDDAVVMISVAQGPSVGDAASG